ncbi:MAG: hypothetical protein VXV98_09105, partial [Candidatus Thermoplasmatota archaeon]|nr:hypothetical protein [Candidatus Thermoplasmatota archaeon]
MATTIQSTALDFTAIKNNLKTSLIKSTEFSDYNFEASGLSNILDVLATNTHFNGLIANFALNESYLGTAQLRSSIVSLAEGIGYVPDSVNASRAIVNLTTSLTGVAGRPNKITIPSGFTFNSTVDGVAYTFQTQEDISATDDGNGSYAFQTADGSADINIFEGVQTTKTFFITGQTENFAYIIPDENMDIDTAVVTNFETAASSAGTTFTDLRNATSITENSRIYILKETPKGDFEITFGNGTVLGVSPVAGNKVTVQYLSSKGADANGGKSFTPVSQINVNGVNYTVSSTTVSNSFGGSPKESIASIRTTAPFQYATQNRMVTAEDYATLVQRNFGSLLNDISSFGGEDALKPEFGVIFLSLLFSDAVENDTTSGETIKQTTKDGIVALAKDLSVASFDVKFTDPVQTFIETTVFFQFNPNLTTLAENAIKSQVQDVVSDYFSKNTGKFKQSFRRSNLLTLIDAVSPSILSSRCTIGMQQRITPTLTAISDYTLRLPQSIATADDVNRI